MKTTIGATRRYTQWWSEREREIKNPKHKREIVQLKLYVWISMWVNDALHNITMTVQRRAANNCKLLSGRCFRIVCFLGATLAGDATFAFSEMNITNGRKNMCEILVLVYNECAVPVHSATGISSSSFFFSLKRSIALGFSFGSPRMENGESTLSSWEE